MRVRNNPNAKSQLNMFERYISKTDKEKINKVINSTSEKVCLEIGMGKGEFLIQMAQNNPNNIYMGVELSDSVLALAVKKLEKYEEENNIKLNNIWFLSFNAKDLKEIFDFETINTLYLNFSDPWPKSKHEKRRLTYKSFLEMYKNVLKKDGTIEMKTDNRRLFESSIISINNFGFKINEIYLDLHNTDIPNVVTEYESKFCKLGPIYKIVVPNF